MKADWLITTTEPIDLDIEEVTLLSKEEFNAAKDIIPAVNAWWWLRSPGFNQLYAAYVDYDGSLYSRDVSDALGCVRPALRIGNLKSYDLESGDKVRIADKTWTVISSELVLCDGFIGQSAFRKGDKLDDANVYETSDVKKFLDAWAERNGLLENKPHNTSEIIRCIDCGEYREDGYCYRHHFDVKGNWYCADGYK